MLRRFNLSSQSSQLSSTRFDDTVSSCITVDKPSTVQLTTDVLKRYTVNKAIAQSAFRISLSNTLSSPFHPTLSFFRNLSFKFRRKW